MSSRSRESAGSKMEPEPYDFRPQLADEQWALIADLFRDPAPDSRGGRPRADARRCIEGILWVLRSGSRWKDLPRCFPSHVTCWRRFVVWSGEGIWDRAWRRLVHLLDGQGKVAWKEGLRRWLICPCKKRGDCVGPTKRGKGSKLMLLVDATGLPLAVQIDSASPAEVTLIEPLIDGAVPEYVPPCLIYDKAADSDPLRERLEKRNIELICPHRRGRVSKATQDGRPLRKYRRRGIIERTIGGCKPSAASSLATNSIRFSFTDLLSWPAS